MALSLMCVCAFCPCNWQSVHTLDNLFCLVTSEICAAEQCNSKSRQIRLVRLSVLCLSEVTVLFSTVEKSFQLGFVLTLFNILRSLIPIENSNTRSF